MPDPGTERRLPMPGGRYRLERCIGVGGMSEVWRGFDEALARPVAVKLITRQQASDDACYQRRPARTR